MTSDRPLPSGLAERVLEAIWLAALIVAPLLFTPATDRVFELSNTAFVRALAMGALCLALGRRIMRGPEARSVTAASEWGWRSLLRGPIVPAALALLLISGISTALSVAPAASLFGSYLRNQGLYTTFAYVSIFLVIVSALRTRAQRQRITDVMLLSAFFVAGYAILQRFGLDPVLLGSDWEPSRVSSTLGNPIFLGGFLILTIPIGLAELLRHVSHAAEDVDQPARLPLPAGILLSLVFFVWNWIGGAPQSGAGDLLGMDEVARASLRFASAVLLSVGGLALWALAAYRLKRPRLFLCGLHTFLLSTLLAGLLFSGSRGPLLGLAAGLLAFGLLTAAARRMGRRTWAALLGGGLLLGGAGLVLAVSPLAKGLCDEAVLGRVLCHLNPTDPYQRPRILIWTGVLDLAAPHAPIASPSSGPDRYNTLRPLLGYGPESLPSVFPSAAPRKLERVFTPGTRVDRAHNATLDGLADTGLLGAGAFLLLVAGAYELGLRQLGLLQGRQRRLFWASLAAGAGTVSLAAVLLFGSAFLGVSIPVGLLAGGLGFVVARAIQTEGGVAVAPWARAHLPVIGILSAVTAHFVEIQVGIPTTATQVYFWMLLGPLAARSRRSTANEPDVSGFDVSSRLLPQDRGFLFYGVLSGFAIAVAGVGFVQGAGRAGPNENLLQTIGAGLFQVPTANGPIFAASLAGLLGLTLLVGAGLACCDPQNGRGWTGTARTVALFAAASLTVFSVFTVGNVALARALSAVEGEGASLAPLGLAGPVAACLAAMAAALRGPGPAPPGSPRPGVGRMAAAWCITLLGVFWIARTDLAALQVGALAARSGGGENRNAEIELSERMISLQPWVRVSLVRLAAAYTAAAFESVDPASSAALYARAEETWRRAQALDPYEFENELGLAGLEKSRSSSSAGASEALVHWDDALRHEAAALELSPNAPYLHVLYALDLWQSADFKRQLGQQGEATLGRAQARQEIARAVDLDPQSCLAIAGRATFFEGWREIVSDALVVLTRKGCHAAVDPFTGEADELALQALLRAGNLAAGPGEQAAFVQDLREGGSTSLILGLFGAKARVAMAEGRPAEALEFVEFAYEIWPLEAAESQAGLLEQILQAMGAEGGTSP